MRVVTLVLATSLLAATSASCLAGDGDDAGQSSFNTNCAVCHQATGAGNPALAPPLLTYPARYMTTPAGRQQLAMTVLYGLYGDVVVEDKHYNFKMPSFTHLEDDALAQTLNYVVFELAKAPRSLAPFTAEEIAATRAKRSSGAEVRAHRLTVLEALGL